MTKRITQPQEQPSQTPHATMAVSPPVSLSRTEESIVEALDAIQSQLEQAEERTQEIIDRIEDLQIKLEDIETSLTYPSSGASD